MTKEEEEALARFARNDQDIESQIVKIIDLNDNLKDKALMIGDVIILLYLIIENNAY